MVRPTTVEHLDVAHVINAHGQKGEIVENEEGADVYEMGNHFFFSEIFEKYGLIRLFVQSALLFSRW